MRFNFFNSGSDEEKERKRLEKEQRIRLEESLLALNSGGITPAAKERLTTVAAQHTAGSQFFTATTSPAGLMLFRQAGYKPITQVMGSSVVKELDNGMEERLKEMRSSGEVTSCTTARNDARIYALLRLMQEAEILGADGVVDVKINIQRFGWAPGVMEFTAVGTAITVPNKPDFSARAAGEPERKDNFFSKKPKSTPMISTAGKGMVKSVPDYLSSLANRPFLSHLSAQEFWQLYQLGYWPLGIVAGNCSYYVSSDNRTRSAQGGLFASLQNQELTQMSDGLAHTRYQATNRMKKESRALSADGAVGVEIESEVETLSDGMLMHFRALGTAVRTIPGFDRSTSSAQPVQMIVNLADEDRRAKVEFTEPLEDLVQSGDE